MYIQEQNKNSISIYLLSWTLELIHPWRPVSNNNMTYDGSISTIHLAIQDAVIRSLKLEPVTVLWFPNYVGEAWLATSAHSVLSDTSSSCTATLLHFDISHICANCIYIYRLDTETSNAYVATDKLSFNAAIRYVHSNRLKVYKKKWKSLVPIFWTGYAMVPM